VPPVVQISSRFLSGADGPFPTADPRARYAELVFKDNGIGFEQQYAKRIFELFQRLHGIDSYDGTGIGLSLCMKVAENHGGTILAQSAPGEGATFTVFVRADH
jgi:signal transduction histidine kinase